MSKEFAREKIQEYLSKNGGVLPAEDSIAYQHFDSEGNLMQEFTFKFLLCVAYDLEKNYENI